MFKKQTKVQEPKATGQVEIKKRSKVPGVMITQFVEEIPEGKSHPDFFRKPIALTIQQGKSSFFKAIVFGDPEPTVTWARSNGDVSDTTKYQPKFDPVTNEHTFEMPHITPELADTYKCFAVNEFGKAVVTVVLNVIAVGFQKTKPIKADETKIPLKRKSKIVPEQPAREKGEIDPKFWEILLSADKKDYESICVEYGVTDFRFVLKKLNEMKKEREEEQAQFIKHLSNLKPIDFNSNGTASFEFDMELIDPNSRIFMYKDGVMVPYTKELGEEMKHSLSMSGRKMVFSVKDLLPDDAGLYQVDVEDVNIFSTDFKIPVIDFLVKIQEVKAMEREDAMFECVLSNPFSRIMWVGKNLNLEQGEKYDIEASEDKLIHRLIVKDCSAADKGIYAAVAGLKSCNAFLIVEAEPDSKGKKKERKTTRAGGAGVDLAKVAQEQQVKLQEKKEQVKVERAERAAAPPAPPPVSAPAPAPAEPAPAPAPVATPPKQSECDSDGAGSQGVVTIDPTIVSGLSDVYAVRGQPAQLECKLDIKCDGAWFKDGEKLSPKVGLDISKVDTSHQLKIARSLDDDAGLYRFEAGGCKSEASVSVGDIPEFDADDLHKFSKPVIVKVGQSGAFKMPYTPQDGLQVHWFKDGVELKDGGGVKVMKETNHSRLLFRDCLRSDGGEVKIKLSNPFGAAEATSRLIVLDKPGPPQGPVEVLESSSTLIEVKWNPPLDDGGSPLTNYMIERQQMGQSIWIKLGDVAADKTSYRDRNVAHGKRYLYRFSAENPEGLSDPLETENAIMAGILIFPNPPGAPQVVSTSKTCIKLTWTAPPERDPPGPKLMGYQLEKCKKDTAQWIALNTVNEPIEGESYACKDVTEGSEYQFRVSGINVSGAGEPSPPSPMTCAKNPNMKPQFKNPEDFMVVRAGNSVRIKINYEAEPPPDITWLKDDEPVSSWLNVINTDGSSQLVVPSSKRPDSGVYTIMAKNSVGQASFDIEVRVTDEPKSPGAVALEQTVHGKVVVSWEPSPDEEIDDRLHYLLAEHDSHSRMWRTAADRLFCKTYTVHNILQGREYHFRVYAKNDMGLSDPSDSPTWGINSNRVPIATNTPSTVSLDRPPTILVPLKVHTPPKGYQLYMTCAVGGYPTPTVLWYLDDVCITYDNNYYITNAQGVCSIYILRVAPKDSGAYRVVAVNSFGKAVCSTNLVVKD